MKIFLFILVTLYTFYRYHKRCRANSKIRSTRWWVILKRFIYNQLLQSWRVLSFLLLSLTHTYLRTLLPCKKDSLWSYFCIRVLSMARPSTILLPTSCVLVLEKFMHHRVKTNYCSTILFIIFLTSTKDCNNLHFSSFNFFQAFGHDLR